MSLHGYEHYVRGNYSNSFNFHIYTNNYVWVDHLLTLSSRHQTREQRLRWINQKWIRSIHAKRGKQCCWGLYIWSHSFTYDYELTALQIAILKDDENMNGLGSQTESTHLAMARRLLELGADEEINYQEPIKGNSALHYAYARRDLAAIVLLEDHGASTRAVNHSGKKPREMLNLSYHEARSCCLLASLNVSRFNSEGNLAAIKQRFDSASVREYSLISIAPH